MKVLAVWSQNCIMAVDEPLVYGQVKLPTFTFSREKPPLTCRAVHIMTVRVVSNHPAVHWNSITTRVRSSSYEAMQADAR